ncbi:protein-S-isoprenylcysteine O-methyltransferase-like [Corticium candelabrum]|uniref:protein-S-isoprenylcysteine O-methyltransferase-like n=1 Tax=Corticium candelabrum TaxID=121492 RepID=UPI002E259518|nr:protein-S-isoprenylcysteine O-methyltransferase-like [Corticium candelabrum]
MSALAFFHWSEYFTTALFNNHKLSLDSFLLNHSKEYTLAAMCSWLEYGVEYYFFPFVKSWVWLSRSGVVMVIVGESLRKVAMFTSRSNFSHSIAYKKTKDHQLVTHGIYSWFRHPSYVGWFYWSIGTQLLLSNPVCLVGYTVASWKFFRERIEEEEMTLLAFFGRQYLDYQQRVATGLPLVRGYEPTYRERYLLYNQ